MEVTENDLKNNPGVDEHTLKSIKAQYHLHRISSVSLHNHTLLCTFQIDPDRNSVYYTPLEWGLPPIRSFSLPSVEGDVCFDGRDGSVDDVRVADDGLGVFISSMVGGEDEFISSEEIWQQGSHKIK